MTATRSARSRTPSTRARLGLELLESRDVPHALVLTPLVEVSGPSPFLGHPIEANDPAFGFNAETNPNLAVNPSNPNHLLGTWIQDFVRGIVAAVSFNGGNTWQPVVVPGITQTAGGPYPHSSDPWVSFAPDGTVYLSSVGFDYPRSGTPNAILVSRSTDGGLTWATPTAVATGLKDFHDKVTITADPYDSRYVYAAWSQFKNSKGVAMFSRTTDGGQTWEPPRELFNLGGNSIAADFQIAVLPDGTLVNAFFQQLYRNDAGGIAHFDLQLSLVRSRDHGQTWQSVNAPIVAADMRPGGDTDAEMRTAPNPDGGTPIRDYEFFFDLAVDLGSGNLYAVWPDSRFGGGSQSTGIAFSMSADGGLNWSTPIKVNQTPDTIPAGNRTAILPAVAVNSDGVVAVSYYDFRNNTPAAGLPTDVWMVHAHPSDGLTNPASWSSENRITPGSFDMEAAPNIGTAYLVSDYQGLVAQGRHFGAFFSMPSGSDRAGIFYRDPLPAVESPTPTPDVSVIPGELPVTFNPGVTQAEIARLYADHGFSENEALDNAAGRGWFVDRTPHGDFEFMRPGNQGERNRMDLLTELMHEVGHLLGRDHEAAGTMAETLAAGTRLDPVTARLPSWIAGVDGLWPDTSPTRRRG
jgi:hypothetical protein